MDEKKQIQDLVENYSGNRGEKRKRSCKYLNFVISLGKLASVGTLIHCIINQDYDLLPLSVGLFTSTELYSIGKKTGKTENKIEVASQLEKLT